MVSPDESSSSPNTWWEKCSGTFCSDSAVYAFSFCLNQEKLQLEAKHQCFTSLHVLHSNTNCLSGGKWSRDLSTVSFKEKGLISVWERRRRRKKMMTCWMDGRTVWCVRGLGGETTSGLLRAGAQRHTHETKAHSFGKPQRSELV